MKRITFTTDDGTTYTALARGDVLGVRRVRPPASPQEPPSVTIVTERVRIGALTIEAFMRHAGDWLRIGVAPAVLAGEAEPTDIVWIYNANPDDVDRIDPITGDDVVGHGDGLGYACNLDDPWGSEWGSAPWGPDGAVLTTDLDDLLRSWGVTDPDEVVIVVNSVGQADRYRTSSGPGRP